MPSNTTLVNGRHDDPRLANKAALELGKLCRSECGIIMLSRTRLGDNVVLNDNYMIGRWEKGVNIAPDNLYLMHQVQGSTTRITTGKVSGQVRILSEYDQLHYGKTYHQYPGFKGFVVFLYSSSHAL